MLQPQLLAPVLIGRRVEFDALLGLLAEAVAGRGGLALVGGDAGIGKSRLCRELRGEAAARDVRVIEGRCSPAESSLPFGPFIDALRFRIARGEGAEVAEVVAPILGNVAPLFAGLGEPDREAEPPPARTVAVPFEPIFQVIRRLARLGPVLMLIEDIHWADATSRDLLHYLAHRLRDEPVLLVSTYRTDELHPGHPVHRLVATLARERAAQRVQLEPLAAGEVRDMLAAMLGAQPEPGLDEAVFARTEGNPLFIEELVGALAELRPEKFPRFDAADLAEASPPATIHDIVLGRVEPLGADAGEALAVAAVIGRRFRFDVLAAALGWPESRLLPAVEILIHHRLLLEEAGGGGETFAFRHALVQEVVYNSAIGRRRRIWHRRVAAALEAVGSETALPHTRLAHHYRLGGDSRKARDHSILAGDEAARLCAWPYAESLYEQALAAHEQEQDPDRELEAEIFEKMAVAAWWQDRMGAFEQYAEEALALRRAQGDFRRAANLLRRLANLYAYQHGRVERAVDALREALAPLADDCAEAVFIMNDLGRLQLARGDYDAAEAWLERALAASGVRGDCSEEALSLVLLGHVAVLRGQVLTGVRRLELARVLLADHALPPERAAEVFHSGIRALEAAREHERARAWAEAALAHAEKTEAAGDRAIYAAYLAAIDRRAGRWEAALAAAKNAADKLRALGRAELREALRILGDLYRVRGENAAARAAYEEALYLGFEEAAIGLALLLMAEGDWASAASRLERAGRDRPAGDRLFALRLLPLQVEAHVRAGRLEQAEAAAARLAGLVAESEYRAGPAALAHATGLLRGARGEAVDAAAELEAALHGWAELDLPYEAARAKLDLAELLLAGGARNGQANGGRARGQRCADERGIELAREAIEALEALGAMADAERGRRLIRAAGGRVPAAPAGSGMPAPLDRLTARELEVLEALSTGATNKQIARTLDIRPKTVGNHVSSVLAKLGCATRGEASRILLESLAAR